MQKKLRELVVGDIFTHNGKEYEVFGLLSGTNGLECLYIMDVAQHNDLMAIYGIGFDYLRLCNVVEVNDTDVDLIGC